MTRDKHSVSPTHILTKHTFGHNIYMHAHTQADGSEVSVAGSIYIYIFLFLF